METASDHIPILLDCFPGNSVKSKRPRAFKFENLWLNYEGCCETINAVLSLSTASSPAEVVCKMDKCKSTLIDWDKSVGALRHRIRVAKTKLVGTLEQLGEDVDPSDVDKCRDELEELLRDEEVYWMGIKIQIFSCCSLC